MKATVQLGMCYDRALDNSILITDRAIVVLQYKGMMDIRERQGRHKLGMCYCIRAGATGLNSAAA